MYNSVLKEKQWQKVNYGVKTYLYVSCNLTHSITLVATGCSFLA